MDTHSAWYLIQCKPRESFRAELHLKNQHIQCFHPAHRVKKKTVNGVRSELSPLFPHYLFAYLHSDSNWAAIRCTRGVSRIVSFNQTPLQVPESVVMGLMRHCALLNKSDTQPFYKMGERVRITEGCFKELEAIVTATKGEERVVLLLNLLNRPQQIELPVRAVTAV